MINFEVFEKDFCQVLGLEGGRFEESAWTLFLNKYFNQKEGGDLQKMVCEDLNAFREQDPSVQKYYLAKIISIRSEVLTLMAYRVLNKICERSSEKTVLYESEWLMNKIFKRTGSRIHPMAQIGHSVVILGSGVFVGEGEKIPRGTVLDGRHISFD